MKKFDLRWLPYMGAVVQAGLFAFAGDAYFGGRWGWLVGLGVGAVVNTSLAVASSRISEIAQKRKGLARLALVGMFLLSPATITLSLYMPESVFTSIAWAVSPDMAIVLAGSIAGKSLVELGEPAKSQPKRKAKPVEPAAEPIQPAFVCSCGKEFRSQPALNAHQRSHKQIIGYTASFEPVTKEQVQRKP